MLSKSKSSWQKYARLSWRKISWGSNSWECKKCENGVKEKGQRICHNIRYHKHYWINPRWKHENQRCTGVKAVLGPEFNSSNMETWHNIVDNDLKELKKLDNCLIRKIIGAHSKVPVKFLYLETSATPIEFILKSRRINYLHTLLSRSDS